MMEVMWLPDNDADDREHDWDTNTSTPGDDNGDDDDKNKHHSKKKHHDDNAKRNTNFFCTYEKGRLANWAALVGSTPTQSTPYLLWNHGIIWNSILIIVGRIPP